MALTINKGGAAIAPQPIYDPTGVNITTDQVEIFGRLRLTLDDMAQYFGISYLSICKFMRRPDMRAAYQRGMTEAKVAIRQKMLTLALGSEGGNGQAAVAPSERMLLHVSAQHGDNVKIDPHNPLEGLDFTDGHVGVQTWDGDIKARALALREKLVKSGGAG